MVFAAEDAIFAEAYTDVEHGMWVQQDDGVHDGGDLLVIARRHRNPFHSITIV
jgi:hypothetical protein